jgi:biopolymer transport protein ExbD
VKSLVIALTLLFGLVHARAETTATPTSIIVSIDKDGKLAVNGVAVARDEDLEPKLRSFVFGKAAPAVSIAADVKAPKGRVTFVIAEAKRAGITKIGVMAAPKKS